MELSNLGQSICKGVCAWGGLIRGTEGKGGCSDSGGLKVLTTFKCSNQTWVRVPGELGQGLFLV